MNLANILKGDEPTDVDAAIQNFYEKRRNGSRLPQLFLCFANLAY
jgi:hypothetical protein